jgi:anti-anti-sigma factor
MNSKELRTETHINNGVPVIAMHGDINDGAEAALQSAYDQASKQNAGPILLNFGGVDYINSTGIALVVGLLARARKERRPLLACGLSEHYQEIFAITRLSDFMQTYGDEATAVNSALAQ